MPFSSWFGGGATDHQSATKTNGKTCSHHRKVSLGMSSSSGKKSSIHHSTHSERLRKQVIVAIEPEGDNRRIDQGLIDASVEAKDMVHQQNVSSSSSWWPSTFSATATTSTPQPSVASQIGGTNSISLANSNEVKSNAAVKSPGHHRRVSSKQTFKLP